MRKKALKIVFSLIVIYLFSVFIISAIVSYKRRETKNVIVTDIVKYSLNFLDNEYLIKKGKKLDCSGFTRFLYGHFQYKLPASAMQQYNSFYVNDLKRRPGDLIYFSLNNNEINHVGLMMNDSIFIHSPGINKPVRKDNLKSSYWFKYYKGIGRVIK